MASAPLLQVPKYRIHKATKRAFIWWNKKRHYLGKAKSPESHEAYNRFVANILTSQGKYQPGPPDEPPVAKSKQTVGDLILAYFAHVKKLIHIDEYQCLRYSCRPLRALYEHTPINEFRPKMLKLVRKQMIQDGLCRKTVNHRISRIKRMFKWGVAEEYVPATVYQALCTVEGLKWGQTEAKESMGVSPVSDEDIEVIIPFLSPVVVAMIRLQRLTGLRPGEVCRMRPIDIDQSGEIWIYRPFSHKNKWRGLTRDVPLGPKAQAIIQPFLDRPDDAPLFSTDESYSAQRKQQAVRNQSKRKTPIYPSELKRLARQKAERAAARPKTYQPYKTRSYARAIRYAFEQAEKEGVVAKKFALNQLRHSRATEVRKDYGLEAAQVILGHVKADVTQIYAERNLNLAIQIAKETG